VIRIDASERVNYEDEHPSESSLTGFDGFDHVIENNATEKDFREKIDFMFPLFMDNTNA